MLALAATALAWATPVQAAPAAAPVSVDLICRGWGEIKRQERVEVRHEGKPSTWRYESRPDPFRGETVLHIRGLTGEATLPPAMMALADGSGRTAPLIKIAVGEDRIDGKVKINFLYAPVFSLNRVTGELTITGSMSDYQARCEPYEAARDRMF